MNENLDLTKILKDCPEGTKLYSPIFGDVELVKVHNGGDYPIEVKLSETSNGEFTKDGRFFLNYDGECMLFPSREERDWSKLKDKLVESKFKDGDSVPNKFDPKTLQPFDKVLVRDSSSCYWNCDFFSRIDDSTSNHKYITVSSAYIFCIPYNDETKHLLVTTKEAPEYYRYWEE